jgi:hypothetical protein
VCASPLELDKNCSPTGKLKWQNFVCILEKIRGDEAISGDSDYVRDDTFSEMEEIPKEVLNAIDSFNVESDEEFLGFE